MAADEAGDDAIDIPDNFNGLQPGEALLPARQRKPLEYERSVLALCLLCSRHALLAWNGLLCLNKGNAEV